MVITYDTPEKIRTFTTGQKIDIPVLSDPGSRTIRAYGVLKEDEPKDSETYGIPYPGTFVVDTSGTVRQRLFLEGYRVRHSVDALIAAARALGPPLTKN